MYMFFDNESHTRHLYYNRLFPRDLIVELFGGRNEEMGRREIALRIANNQVFVRYFSPPDQGGLRAILDRDCPSEFFIGAIYNVPPNQHKKRSANKVVGSTSTTYSFYAEKHEFVIDLDMSDYDKLRTCCKDKDICNKCWTYMCIACEILHETLTHDFGFNEILWTYSGNRGIHCWVFDERVLCLESEERMNILNYFELGFPREDGNIAVKLQNPAAKRSYRIGLKYFNQVLSSQDCLRTKYGLETLLGYMPDEVIRRDLASLAEQLLCTSLDLWQMFVTRSNNDLSEEQAVICQMRVVIHMTFPRIDMEVSRQKEHLLRCPLSLHPRTRRLATPFRPETVAQFDITTLPIIHEQSVDEMIAQILHMDEYKRIITEVIDKRKSDSVT